MERETLELKIGSRTFVVKAYATAREAQAIQQALFKGTKIEVAGQEPRIADFNPAAQFDLQNAMVAQMVVSLDGGTENITERCLDLPSNVYTELVEKLDALVSKKKT
jgi:hypothetical protein